ncbi:MAG: MBOAT family protein [Bacteroidia bacterium]|nr:MBOAT family protein [Bacteroidia bacterium]
MTFNSIAFLIFLPVVYLLFRVFPQRQKWVLLLLASYFFYCFVTPWYGILLLLTTAVDYFAALKIENALTQKQKKSWLALSIVSNLGVLVSFKYSAFFANCGLFAYSKFSGNSFSVFHDLIVPAGLSFYTFQSMSYTIDVYRGKTQAQKHFGLFALFVSFFPHLVAGPIQKFDHLFPQLKKLSAPEPDSIFPHFRLIIWGFFKKLVIADNLAKIIDPIQNNVQNFSGSVHLFVGFLFCVQLYCDFSGYTDIATGIAKLFGVDFTINWKRPLLARSVHSFWKRHHISMTTWFREYLYFSLGGDKTSTLKWVRNVFIVFLVSGLWHGASFTFVLWGAMHAVAYIIQKFCNKKFQLPAFAGWLIFISFHSFSFIAFRAKTTDGLISIYNSIFYDFNFSLMIPQLHSVTDWFPFLICVLGIVILFTKEIAEEFSLTQKFSGLSRYLRPVFYWILFFAIFLAGDFNNNEFIYFKF